MKVLAAVSMLVLAAVAGAQAPVPTRSLGPVVATSEPMGSVRDVRQLSDGRVLVNDQIGRRILLFDSTLKTSRAVLDSAGPPDRRYGGRGGSLIPYLADTTLFSDPVALALLVIDGNGTVARVGAPPSGRGAALNGNTRVDARGRLLFSQTGGRSSPAPAGAEPGMRMTISYSVMIAFDMVRHTVDTVFWIRADTAFLPGPTPGVARVSTAPLFSVVTAHTVMSDGTIAVVRGQDYHVDWIAADGSITRSPRIAHEWKRLSDDDKKRMADSITVVRDSLNKITFARMAGTAGATVSYDAAGRAIMTTSISLVDGVALPLRTTAAPRPPPPQAMMPVPPDLMPDYMPAIGSGVLADADNQLWIPLAANKVAPNTRVFDIVDRSGKLVDRVSVDPSITIVGFGKGGNVYLFVRDGGVGRLQRARFR